MCGIAGIYTKNQVDNEVIKNVEKMGDVIKHRGPDDSGFYQDDKIALIHKRLSIIDLCTGRQPIYNENKSLVLIFNGEIYNYLEIKEKLIKLNHQFVSKTDAEVIIHSYEEYGYDCVNIFNGMFSFAIWDNKNKQLFFARDKIGIKPFYYFGDNNHFIFASEIKAIVSTNYVKSTLNEETLIDFLTFQNILDNKTFFKNIFKLLPGHLGILKNNDLTIKKYWDLDFNKKISVTIDEAKKIFLEKISETVQRQMISDVPLGAYLSGGFDSTTVAYFTRKHSKEKLNTFTGYFDEGLPYDERCFSKLVAKSINANIYEIEIKPDDFKNLLKKVVWHLDEPSVGSGALPQYIVSGLVSKYVKVVLTGHGGDELFSGYQVFKAHYLKRKTKENPFYLFSNLHKIKFSEIWHLLYFTFYPLLIDENVKYGLFVMFNNKNQKKLFTHNFYKKYSHYNSFDVLSSNILKNKNFEDEDLLTFLYLKTYLPTLLLQEDKVGMAHSIEARIPFCDDEMIKFGCLLNSDIKLYNLELKSLTKNAMRGILPEELYYTSKKGFPTPIAKWFRTHLKSFIYETLLNKNALILNYIDFDYLKKYIDNFMKYQTVALYDYAQANKIYSLLTIEYWLQNFLI
ncbi:MAG TPA: asparagine synthase (glutamine-hydrolyzing) [bacterium]|nr:asparagine synthase (glutamine-hydrolyzing) [bacterium]